MALLRFLSFFFILFCLFFIFFFSSSSFSESTDVLLVLGKIKTSFLGGSGNIQLATWNSSLPLCDWRGLKWVFADGSPLICNGSQRTNRTLYKDPLLQLLSIELSATGLSGTIPSEIGELSWLQTLYLGVNSLKGNIPLELGNIPSLSRIDFSENMLNGSLPPSMWNLCNNLQLLSLHGNNFSGSIPKPSLPFSTCKNLQVLDLGDNNFVGEFPEFLTGFHGLKDLDISANHLSGSIPSSLTGLQLDKLNVSFNNFSGILPKFDVLKFAPANFEGNDPSLCGIPLKKCKGKSGLSPGAIAGIVIGLMSGIVILASVLIWLSQNRMKNGEEEDDLQVDDNENIGEEGRLILFQGGEHLTSQDVLNANGQVLEKTSYGTVYKAKLAEGATIALRLLREGSCKDQGSCLEVIKQLGRIRHENLVPIRAFYQGERGQKLLIYDYHSYKTLHDLLHAESRAGRPLLNWFRRHKIALGVARGLSHLHNLQTPISHGNVRSHNVLVDEFYATRLTEYGIDRILIPAVSDEILIASKEDGYKAPELKKMKNCNPRTDVYSFGILLLEILLGKKPGKDPRNGEFIDLPALVKVAVLEETTMEIFDVDLLKGIRSPMEDGLVHALKLAMGCCAPVDTVRPTMDEVVKQLEENRPRNRSALYSPTDIRSGTMTPL